MRDWKRDKQIEVRGWKWEIFDFKIIKRHSEESSESEDDEESGAILIPMGSLPCRQAGFAKPQDDITIERR
ncbi:hypothetical protein A3D77_03900 [Candidatus Gottesmanbacteria bacterium RIFCSPHIGHO2_02_FULL_39_11]|uniref:Uncharacterized protein n=1 Tax=Candidatus Gottesmanbacteria bacterium RIFCSPHIGHO2_02_FULL_39_11 TaxID=1798382 RepID=A0A1F5ZJR4_9BACT|nr:MAG: hypothetical protein A3D77_03900 [Candidatus Gottesmanbacteria bacterium RIFCSPHIGHO2_02_FULL_39_11]